MGGMKYIVVRLVPHSPEEIFVFASTWVHVDFADVLRRVYQTMEVVSAGHLSNYPFFGTDPMVYDQIRLDGESQTLHVKSRPEDEELFRRLTDGGT